jgi:diguanylate cyclase (GGDEF)-like protein
MIKDPLLILLILMTLAITATFIIGMRLKKFFIINYKYSITSVMVYNILLITSIVFTNYTIGVIIINAIPVIGLFVFRNIYVEFYRSINRKEDIAPVSVFVRVVPFIYTFLMSLSLLQEFVNGNKQTVIIDAFHVIVVSGVLIYQVFVLLDLFFLNIKLKRASLEKYQNTFLNNILGIVIYIIVVCMNIIMGTLEDNITISGIIYTIMVGFLFLNHIHEDTLYEAKLFQKKIVHLQEDEIKHEEANAFDNLTGVFTREYFIRHIKTFDKDDETLSVVILQMTGLKLINESFGYEYGDEILQEVSLITTDIFQDSTIARMSGSTFAIMQTGYSEKEIKNRIKVIKTICSDRDGFVVDLHFGHYIRNDNILLLYDIYRRAEEDLYHHKVKLNQQRQVEISSMLYTNFGMLLPTLSGHLKRCADFSESFARYLKYDELYVYDIRNAALLHDISLTFMPNIVEYKVAVKDDFDKRSYRSHASKGYDIAVESGINPRTSKGILYHHENYDGTGYPEGLKSSTIPMIAQIVSIVDLVDMIMNYGLKTDDLEEILTGKINVEFSDELVYNMIGFLKLRGIIKS